VPNIYKFREPQTPGNLRACPDLYWEIFIFYPASSISDLVRTKIFSYQAIIKSLYRYINPLALEMDV
jgi:hypothetical protein